MVRCEYGPKNFAADIESYEVYDATQVDQFVDPSSDGTSASAQYRLVPSNPLAERDSGRLWGD
jgi:hypothetical protein